MTKYLIIDDESIAHDIIERYCSMIPSLVLAHHCYDAIEAIEYLQNNSVDLIFLDLNMPKLSGFQFLKTLQNPPKVIVTTAYSEHALEGYELNIVDYLLKPFSFERFLQAVNKALQSQPKINFAKSLISPDVSNKIFIKSNKKHIQIDTSKIYYLEASGNYVKIVIEKEEITVREKLSDMLLQLKDNNIVQVHRSFAVALHHIKSIEGNQIFIHDSIIPIGKFYKHQVDRLLS